MGRGARGYEPFRRKHVIDLGLPCELAKRKRYIGGQFGRSQQEEHERAEKQLLVARPWHVVCTRSLGIESRLVQEASAWVKAAARRLERRLGQTDRYAARAERTSNTGSSDRSGYSTLWFSVERRKVETRPPYIDKSVYRKRYTRVYISASCCFR